MAVRWIAAIVLLLGFAAIGFGIWFLYTTERASGWIAVPGEVIGVDIRNHDSQGQTGLTREQRDRYREYYPQIRYRWQVDGQAFTGSRYRLGEDHPPSDTRAAALDSARQYAAGAAVTVYVDPTNLASAVIDTRSAWATRATPLLLGLLFAALGVTLLIWAEPITRAWHHGQPVDLSD